MCGLCGIFGADYHWTTQLEANGQSSNSQQRRLNRTRRIHHLNRLLKSYHITINDWQGSHYQLQSATGKTILAENLSEIWLGVTQLSGKTYDPLVNNT